VENPSFRSFTFENGLVYRDDSCSLYTLVDEAVFGMVGGTYYVYVHKGIIRANGYWLLTAGMYGSLTRGVIISAPGSRVMIIHKRETNGMNMIGGPVERVGRLKYIDGCTDSLLVPPVKMGDPCLNHLHFPTDIRQTMHTHPSVRIGLVKDGHGECVTPFGNVPLIRGMLFAILPENGEKRMGLDGGEHLVGSHCFYTNDREMDVVAWHPDSDFGPTDEDHPMINRTIVDGVSAKELEDIRTK